ncbi:MAG: hypothetical protein ACYDHH_28325 [Solirubrobacteraceae bacterium]
MDRRPEVGLAVFALVLTSGTPKALTDIAFPPIIFTAYRSGSPGGELAALAGTVLLGPVMYWADLERNGEWGTADGGWMK